MLGRSMDTVQLAFFGSGVLLGLAVAAWVAFAGWRARRANTLELQRLRRHLHDQMEISHEGSSQRRLELERLQRENENLRVTVQAWQQKPDRRELRMLMVYERAVRQMTVNAPSFGVHWETAVSTSEREVEQMDRGVLAFARRLVLPGRRSSPTENDE
jgi:HAMP domain-containing protein